MPITLDAFGNPVVGDPGQYPEFAVSDLAALRSFYTKPIHGTLVTTLGGAFEGDGNGASYRWIDFIIDADDGVNFIKITSISAGRFKLFSTSIGGGGTTGIATAATLAVLKTITSGYAGRVYRTLGYYAAGDAGAAEYTWNAASVVADDGMFTIKATAITTGRFELVAGREVNAMAGGLEADGSIEDTARITAIHALCAAHKEIRTLRLPEGIINTAGNPNVLLTPSGPDVLGCGRWTRLVGPASGFASQFQFASVLAELDTTSYKSHYWTQDLSQAALGAGTRVFTNVTTPAGGAAPLAIGDWVFCRFGADPTDQGEEFERLITQIEDISGTTVTTVDPLRLNCPTTVGINAARLVNKHDMIRIDDPCIGFSIGNFATNNTQINGNTTLGAHIHDIYIEYSTGAFALVQHENTTVERITADHCAGVDIGGGGAFSWYGWFMGGWGHVNLSVRDVDIRRLDGVGFFIYESQSRAMSFTNVSINLESLNSPVGQVGISGTVSGTQGPLFTNLEITGRGSAYFDPHTTVVGMSIRGDNGGGNGPVSVFIQGSQINSSLFFKDTYYNATKFGPPMLLALNPNETRKIKMPLRGVARRMRIRPSTLTGITNFRQYTASPGNFTDLLPELIPGQFNEVAASTNLAGGFAGAFWTDEIELRVSTDGTVPAGATVEVEAEFLISETSLTSEPVKVRGGTSPPTTNADFIGQVYWDTTASPFQMYVAKYCDSVVGADDWTLVSSPASAGASGSLVFNGSIQGDAGGAVTVYLTAGGPLSSANPLRYPTSARTFSKMRAIKIDADHAVPMVITLMKDTSAQTQTITVPTADADFTKYSDLVHPITFADGDTIDIRVTVATDSSAGTGTVSVTLEE